MYCYICGSLKTQKRCPVCGADESRRCKPQSSLTRALRDLFDMKDIGPESTIGNPEQFELLMTDVLPGDQYRYVRMQIHSIVSVYNVNRMLINQIGMHRAPDRDMFRLLCKNALETGYSLKTCTEIIEILYEMIGWPIQSQAALSDLAEEMDDGVSALPTAIQKNEERKPEPGEDVTISMEFTEQELRDGCVRKWPVNRRGVCPVCKGTGTGEDGECGYCHGLGVCESLSSMELSFPACPDASSFIFVGQGSIGLYGGKSGDLRIVVTKKQSSLPPEQVQRSHAQTGPRQTVKPHTNHVENPEVHTEPPKPTARPAKPATPLWRTPSPYLGNTGPGSYGSDVILNLTITSAESRMGCSRRIFYARQIICPVCKGKGCSTCGSKGSIKKQDEITVTIPPHPGEKMFTLPALSGRGNQSRDGKSVGKLIVRVKVEP